MHAWSGTINEFLLTKSDELVNVLKIFENNDNNIESKKKAWSDSIKMLKDYFINKAVFSNSLLIFEYTIPLSGGRRPDIIFIHNNQLYILEFKGYAASTERDQIQCDLYKQYFKHCSSFVIDFGIDVQLFKVTPDTNLDIILKQEQPISLNFTIKDFLKNKTITSSNLLAEFENILNSHNTEFSKGVSENLDEVYSEIENLIHTAKESKKHLLIFINGLPGSGKTMLGLKLACLKNNESMYLSGNDSLIKVFRNKINQFTQKKNPEFIKYFKDFKKSVVHRQEIHQNIFIFDEGQRAWSSQKVEQYYENKADMRKEHIIHNWKGKSEAQIFLDGLLMKDWGVGIILVGNNQEIYLGEEKGLALWNEPFENSSDYADIEVYISEQNQKTLLKDVQKINVRNNLFLKKNYRSYGNELLYEWVDLVLDGDLKKAKEIKKTFKEKTAFFLETSCDLNGAIKKALDFYPNTDEKSIGLLKSSGVALPKKDGKNSYYLAGDKAVIYFNGHKDRKEYCNKLQYMANEFECQGLELDFVIFYWGNELGYKNGKWTVKNDPEINQEQLNLKINAYRVLLTRAREGMIVVFTPKN
ncbi:DNA/RNA helicase domain-containing protein [Acinetobacter sp. Marseille-Q1618]|uniref:DNA/RNA helicase domain-containing protein n=1 Tax=Acinetobacter sp. Marseille-Q1618 TaxID=2697502 RepID=UPI00156E71AC|nr:DNA/RNA helicase domain-containing protein [Acinetobacter sp. Marseille-Q1618]